MGTVVTITIAGTSDQAAAEAARRAFEEMERVDRRMSVAGASSDLMRLNERIRGDRVHVGQELAGVLRVARDIAAASAGAFDPTIGGVARLWDFENGGRIPGNSEIAEEMNEVGWKYIEIDESRGIVGLGQSAARVDLGGIAKGHALDAAIRALAASGVAAAIVDAGGDLRLLGGKPGTGAWTIGVQDPRQPGRLAAKIELADAAVATSGDYERFFIEGGIRYHHILDPASGMPARGCRSVTVIAPTALEADALATAVFVLGPDRGLRLLRSRSGVDGLIIAADGSFLWSRESLRNDN